MASTFSAAVLTLAPAVLLGCIAGQGGPEGSAEDWFRNLAEGKSIGGEPLRSIDRTASDSPAATKVFVTEDSWTVSVYGQSPWMIEVYRPGAGSAKQMLAAMGIEAGRVGVRKANPFSMAEGDGGTVTGLTGLPQGWITNSSRDSIILIAPEVASLVKPVQGSLAEFRAKSGLSKIAGRTLSDLTATLGPPTLAFPVNSRETAMTFKWYFRGLATDVWLWLPLPKDMENAAAAKEALLKSAPIETIFQFDNDTVKPVSYIEAEYSYRPVPSAIRTLAAALGIEAPQNVKLGQMGTYDGKRDLEIQFGADNEFWVRNIPGLPGNFEVILVNSQVRVRKA